MVKYLLAATAAVASTVTLSQGVSAGEAASEPARQVVYRADELIRTETLSMTVQLDGQNMARLHSDDAVVVTVPAGQHVLRGSIPGSQPLVLDLKPGQTHHFHSDVNVHGAGVKLQFSEVEEQVARVHSALEGAI